MSNCEILIGTSGYAYPDWKDLFYPEKMKQDEYLQYYATKFNVVELNFSYYVQPREDQLKKMVEQTNGKMRFSIKGYQGFTHEVDPGNWKNEVKKFKIALAPLISERLLTSILIEFPYKFHYVKVNRIYLAELLTELHGLPVVIEFRNAQWLNERVYTSLKDLGVSLCICDMPNLENLPHFNAYEGMPKDTIDYKNIIIGDIGYIRFHGRNAEKWYGTNAVERYNYLYTDEQLMPYIPIINEIKRSAQIIQIFFNNHAKAAAVVNALKMKLLLENVVSE